VADEVAKELGAALLLCPAAKARVPRIPEIGFGAVGVGSAAVLNDEAVALFELNELEIHAGIADARARLTAHGPLAAPFFVSRETVADRALILVDDGAATGYTALAAIGGLVALGARNIVAAVPVVTTTAAATIRGAGARMLSLIEVPTVGAFIPDSYRHFGPVAPQAVTAILATRGFAPPSSQQHATGA
jgi:predicted phosphoribosyltransferase